MKFRTGFVSNSSSGSYILITTPLAHDIAAAKPQPEDYELSKNLFAQKRIMILDGKRLICWHHKWGEDYSYTNDIDIADEVGYDSLTCYTNRGISTN